MVGYKDLFAIRPEQEIDVGSIFPAIGGLKVCAGIVRQGKLSSGSVVREIAFFLPEAEDRVIAQKVIERREVGKEYKFYALSGAIDVEWEAKA